MLLTVLAINSLISQGSDSGGFAYIIKRTMRVKSVLIYAEFNESPMS